MAAMRVIPDIPPERTARQGQRAGGNEYAEKYAPGPQVHVIVRHRQQTERSENETEPGAAGVSHEDAGARQVERQEARQAGGEGEQQEEIAVPAGARREEGGGETHEQR